MGRKGWDWQQLQQLNWNNNVAYLQQMDALMTKKNEACIEGNHVMWFRCNQQLFALCAPIIQKANAKKQLDELNGMLKDCETEIKRPQNQNMGWQNKNISMHNRLTKLEEYLHTFDKAFTQCLFDFEVIKLKPKKKTVDELMQYDNEREE